MKVVILCGGKGTRSYPFTEYFPKPMMPISGTPIVVHLMRIYAEQGFSEFVLSAGHRKEILDDYFEGRFKDWDIKIVDTGSDADTGDRIRRCAEFVGDTFFATYGDGLGDIDLNELLSFHQKSGGLATVTSVPLRSQYGTLVFNQEGQVREFHEKPVIRDYWINAGFFVFERRAFEHWHGHNLEGDVLPALSARSELFSYTHQGFWKSMDTSKDQQELERIHAAGAPWVRRRPGLESPSGDRRVEDLQPSDLEQAASNHNGRETTVVLGA
jgi:glucose-1-phosphate cytidylyltransferase